LERSERMSLMGHETDTINDGNRNSEAFNEC